MPVERNAVEGSALREWPRGVCYKHLVIGLAHVVALTFLPSISLGLALGIAWRFVKVGPLRTALQWIASLLFFAPLLPALWLGAYSSDLRPYQQGLLSLIGFTCSAMMIAALWSPSRRAGAGTGLISRAARWRQTAAEVSKTEAAIGRVRKITERPQRWHRTIGLMLGAVVMAGLGLYCGWTTVGDYVLAHDVVAGTVGEARVHRGNRSPNTYEVSIDGKGYNITRDLLAQLRPGEFVQVDVGIASGTVVSIRRDVQRPPTGVAR